MIVIAIAIFILCVLLHGLLVGYETGIVYSDRARLVELASGGPAGRAAHLVQRFTNPGRAVTTRVLGTALAMIIGLLALEYAVTSAWIAAAIAAPCFLVLGEFVPRSLFRYRPNALLIALYPVLDRVDLVLAILVMPTMYVFRGLFALAGAQQRDISPVLSTEEDLRNLIEANVARGSIDKEEQEMIHSIMDLDKIQANEIMVPRIDIQALPETATKAELAELFVKCGRTRIPIYRDRIDSVIGVANVYDVLLDSQDDQSITRFVQDVLHVPDSKTLDELLQELKTDPQHLAIVTDEYGGTDGLVTLEDALEEIFGEIQDEHDAERAQIRQVGPKAYVVEARMYLEDLSEAIGVTVEDDEVETVAGWVMRLAGRIPAQGEKLRRGNFRITILEGQSHQISKVRLDVLEPESETETETPAKEP